MNNVPLNFCWETEESKDLFCIFVTFQNEKEKKANQTSPSESIFMGKLAFLKKKKRRRSAKNFRGKFSLNPAEPTQNKRVRIRAQNSNIQFKTLLG